MHRKFYIWGLIKTTEIWTVNDRVKFFNRFDENGLISHQISIILAMD